MNSVATDLYRLTLTRLQTGVSLSLMITVELAFLNGALALSDHDGVSSVSMQALHPVALFFFPLPCRVRPPHLEVCVCVLQ